LRGIQKINQKLKEIKTVAAVLKFIFPPEVAPSNGY
jgi:hypothetical protein